MALAPLSIFIHSRSKGNVPCVLNDGLPCFCFPRVWKIALACGFSFGLVIAGNALFLRVSRVGKHKVKIYFQSWKDFYWQFNHAVRFSPRCQQQGNTSNHEQTNKQTDTTRGFS